VGCREPCHVRDLQVLDLREGAVADVGAGEHGVEGGGELAVPVADQETKPAGVVGEVRQQVAGLLGHPRPSGLAVIPARCTRRVLCSITTRM
jgi:hypothetical protein